MAERKPGPVKPPVIDLTAREASEATPPDSAEKPATPRPKPAVRPKPAADTAEPAAAAPAPEPQTAVSPPPPRPPARLAMPWSAISIAAVAGAILGAGLTYIVANWVALPVKVQEIDDPAPALATLADQQAALEGRIAVVEDTARKTQVSLDATLVQIDGTTTELRQAIEDVRTAVPDAQPVDLTAIEEELQTLEGRITAIGAGASSADASALAENLVALEQTLAALDERLAGIESRASASDTAVADLRTEVDAAKSAIAAQNRTIGGAEIGPAVRLPLIVSGLESAFANGRPYETELASLTALLPDIDVPEPVAAAASTGLMRPDALVERVETALPDIIAGRTGESTGDLAQDAIEWMKALLALRPAEEIEGETPEAIVSRFEAAVERHDFSAAAAELAQLPEPMRLASGELGTAIAAHAAAAQFVADLRAQALTPVAEGTN